MSSVSYAGLLVRKASLVNGELVLASGTTVADMNMLNVYIDGSFENEYAARRLCHRPTTRAHGDRGQTGHPRRGEEVMSFRARRVVTVAVTAAVLATLLAGAPTSWGQGAQAQAPSALLKEAWRRYESRDYYAASIALHDVIEGQARDSLANRERATFWLGKTLYQLGFYAASLGYFDKVIGNKKSPYRSAVLKWLAALDDKLPERWELRRLLASYDLKHFEQPALQSVRDQLHYLLGRHRYRDGALPQAIAHFGAVSIKSPLYAKARLLLGVAQVRSRAARPAAAAFKDVLRHAQRPGADRSSQDLAEHATLNLARLFYSVKQYALAIKYYDRISPLSKRRPDALLGQSWAFYQQKDDARALKNLWVVNASGLRLPEARFLEALIYFRSNRRRQGLRALEPLFARYPALADQLTALLRRTVDPTDFAPVARGLAKRVGKSSPLQQLVHVALSHRPLQQTFAYVDALDRELRLVQQAKPSWKSKGIAGVVLTELALRKSLAVNEAGTLAQQRLKKLVEEIRDVLRRGKKLQFELSALPNK